MWSEATSWFGLIVEKLNTFTHIDDYRPHFHDISWGCFYSQEGQEVKMWRSRQRITQTVRCGYSWSPKDEFFVSGSCFSLVPLSTCSTQDQCVCYVQLKPAVCQSLLCPLPGFVPTSVRPADSQVPPWPQTPKHWLRPKAAPRVDPEHTTKTETRHLTPVFDTCEQGLLVSLLLLL